MSNASADVDSSLEALFKKLASKDGVHFKHQTRDEPDLTIEQKMTAAREVYEKNPGNFLARFHQHLDEADGTCFKDFSSDYQVTFYLKEIAARNVGQTTKNRRYRAMERLMQDGEYFSLQAMKKRDPLLYEELVGQFSTEDERQELSRPEYNTFSGFLLSSIDRKVEAVQLSLQKEMESNQLEESDDDEEEEMEDEDDKPAAVPEQQKALLRGEFLSIMQDRFLRGEDRDFDYDSLNADQTLDDHKERDLDCEDHYFEDEDSESVRTLSSASSQNFIHRCDIKNSSGDTVNDKEECLVSNDSTCEVDLQMEATACIQVIPEELQSTREREEK